MYKRMEIIFWSDLYFIIFIEMSVSVKFNSCVCLCKFKIYTPKSKAFNQNLRKNSFFKEWFKFHIKSNKTGIINCSIK